MTNPYLRAAQKFPALRQQAAERLSKRPDHAGRPIIPEVVVDRPQPPAAPGRQPEPAQDAVVVRRAKDERGRFKADDPTTPEDEAWEEVP
jgi:hypothetical protein